MLFESGLPLATDAFLTQILAILPSDNTPKLIHQPKYYLCEQLSGEPIPSCESNC
jgi:hypothetical protein